jgi:hypothetical protein
MGLSGDSRIRTPFSPQRERQELFREYSIPRSLEATAPDIRNDQHSWVVLGRSFFV